MLDLAVYWFMFPACILIAAMAMFTGISGTAMLTPFIILIFPLIGVPQLTPAQAIGMALTTEFFGFISGVYGYYRLKLIDYNIVKRLTIVSVPAIIAFALISQTISGVLLKSAYGVLMVVIAAYLWLTAKSTVRNRDLEVVPKEVLQIKRIDEGKVITRVKTADGKTYSYRACNTKLGRLVTLVGAAMEGLISVGLGELEMPNLVRNCKLPIAVSAATSVAIIAVTVLAGASVDMLLLFSKGGTGAIPYNLIIYTIPGAIIGGQIGIRLQGRLSSKHTERFISGLFALIGMAFLYVVLPYL